MAEADKVVHTAVHTAGHLAEGMVDNPQQNQYQAVQLQVVDIHHIQSVLMQVGDMTLPVQNKEVVLILELVDNLSDEYVKSVTALIISESTTNKINSPPFGGALGSYICELS